MRSNIKKSTVDWYIEKINDLGWVVFEQIKVWSTAGDIRPPYPFQYQALCKPRPGDDEPWSGIGGTPMAAVRDLYKELRFAELNPEEEES